ncbi:MAG TPA: hypothetical protein VH020_05290, partial [Stellaceae bacterium]|nr:hypothetical protein [Stellaceae bacterium]
MADERRLTTRMTAKWSALSRDGRLPRHADLDLGAFGKDAANCVVIATTGAEIAAAKLIHVGELLRNDAWSPERQQIVADYQANTLLRLTTAKIAAVIAKRGPVIFGGTGVRDVSAILYRAILLPLSDDGETIDHILGAVNFREITAVEEYSEEAGAPQP